MKLPETEVAVFKLFYNWLYTQVTYDENEDKENMPNTNLVLRLYILADMTRVHSLCNQVIHWIVSSNAPGDPPSSLEILTHIIKSCEKRPSWLYNQHFRTETAAGREKIFWPRPLEKYLVLRRKRDRQTDLDHSSTS